MGGNNSRTNAPSLRIVESENNRYHVEGYYDSGKRSMTKDIAMAFFGQHERPEALKGKDEITLLTTDFLAIVKEGFLKKPSPLMVDDLKSKADYNNTIAALFSPKAWVHLCCVMVDSGLQPNAIKSLTGRAYEAPCVQKASGFVCASNKIVVQPNRNDPTPQPTNTMQIKP